MFPKSSLPSQKVLWDGHLFREVFSDFSRPPTLDLVAGYIQVVATKALRAADLAKS